MFSSDYGITWEDQPTNLGSDIKDLSFFDSNSGLAITDEGEVLLTSLGIIETGNDNLLSNHGDISDFNASIEQEFELMQNHPNPFNPKTQIKFSIPNNEFVILKIYDILGKEVKTLVNKDLERGNHIIDFDGSELSSGIYFYRIYAGKHTEQKRMILIK